MVVLLCQAISDRFVTLITLPQPAYALHGLDVCPIVDAEFLLLSDGDVAYLDPCHDIQVVVTRHDGKVMS